MGKCICHSAAHTLFPGLSSEERHELLFGATCWPFGDCETVMKQMRDILKNTDGSLMGALAYADDITTKAMRDIKRAEEETP